MKTRPVFYCFFVFYLVLFWNFGPSFHRLDCFEFHGYQNSASFETANACSCACSHSSEKQNSGAKDAPSDADVLNDCNCLICDFFSEFNLEFQTVLLTDQAKPFASNYVWQQTFSSSVAITATARGPPLS